ncbi:uncharacterized protein IL334_002746 [Kwoniella shivajii]|uniref:Glycosyltransferase family 8 protein n=1 Tax=Kwoniella shivajii TaxID=564305 RepID=A0ABZ1CVL4_9TREE|nr:hypothetical protein IL334_002746 [Kwoniella shivajii]
MGLQFSGPSSSFSTANPSSNGKLPPPAIQRLSSSSTPNKRKLRVILIQLFGVFFLLSWGLYPFLLNNEGLTTRLHLNPVVEALLPQSHDKALSSLHVNEKVHVGNDETEEEDSSKVKEAYVTFLSSIKDENYLLSTRLLMFQLLHDPLTVDKTHSRDIVIITTNEINQETEDMLQDEGAIIQKVDYLIDGFILPNQSQHEESQQQKSNNNHWKDQYTKLHIFNLTDYSKILYLDNDVFLLKSLEDIWDSENSEIPFGLGGIGERSKQNYVESDLRIEPSIYDNNAERDYLNAGFMLIRPDQELFENLTKTRGYKPFYMEQALINHYFDWEGDHPWTPLDTKFVSHYPKVSDMKEGYYSLHAKMWKDPVDGSVKAAWREGVQRMNDFWHWQRII